MAVAAVGVYAAYADAASGPTEEVVVAARALPPGASIEAGDLRTVAVELPGDLASGTFDSVDAVAGRVALGPIDADEILQRGSLTSGRAREQAHEVALTLPREQVAVGRLKQGERVDVFVTHDESTSTVVRGAQVVLIGDDDGGSLTSARELTLVVAVPTGDEVAAVVHALRTGDVTVVRSTFAGADAADPLVYPAADDDPPSGSSSSRSRDEQDEEAES